MKLPIALDVCTMIVALTLIMGALVGAALVAMSGLIIVPRLIVGSLILR